MNWKWLIVSGPRSGDVEMTSFEYYVFLTDKEAMDFLFDHMLDHTVVDVQKNKNWKDRDED